MTIEMAVANITRMARVSPEVPLFKNPCKINSAPIGIRAVVVTIFEASPKTKEIRKNEQ
jgi:hypothetical protein